MHINFVTEMFPQLSHHPEKDKGIFKLKTQTTKSKPNKFQELVHHDNKNSFFGNVRSDGFSIQVFGVPAANLKTPDTSIN